MKISRQDFTRWLQDEVTQTVFKLIEDKLINGEDELQSYIREGAFIRDSFALVQIARLSGQLATYHDLINIEYQDIPEINTNNEENND